MENEYLTGAFTGYYDNQAYTDSARCYVVTTSVNPPLLGVENLTLSGGWSVPVSY